MATGLCQQGLSETQRQRDYPKPYAAYVDGKTKLSRIGTNTSHIILLIGDSHAQQYWNTMGAIHKSMPGEDSRKPSVFLIKSQTPSDVDLTPFTGMPVKAVIVSYFWSLRYGTGTVKPEQRWRGINQTDIQGLPLAPVYDSAQQDQIDVSVSNLIKAARDLGSRVFLVLDTPFGAEIDPRALVVRSWAGFGIRPPASVGKKVALARSEQIRSRLWRMAQDAEMQGAKVQIIDPFDSLCDKQDCPAFTAEEEPLYQDYDHLSLFAVLNKISYLTRSFDSDE